VIGDLFATAFALWLVREARALGAPWHVTARMLGNVAVDGVVGMVPFAGDAFDGYSAPTCAMCVCCGAGWTGTRARLVHDPKKCDAVFEWIMRKKSA